MMGGDGCEGDGDMKTGRMHEFAIPPLLKLPLGRRNYCKKFHLSKRIPGVVLARLES